MQKQLQNLFLNRKLLLSIIALCMSVILIDSNCYAGWVDDWIAQKSVYGVASFESQKRNFGSLGGASLRWNQGNDYLVTVSPPTFKSGCGGVDLFLGGMDFMKFDHLVEKLKKIMGPSAATFAFDMALGVLCESCSEKMKSFSAMTDRLNQLQLDDCKAQKAVVATLKKETGLGGPAETEAVTDFMTSSGLNPLYKSVLDLGNTNGTTTGVVSSYGGKSAMVAGCPQELKNVFFTPGSLIQNITNTKNLGSAYVDLITALIGDVKISGLFDYNYTPPCDKNNAIDIDAAMNGYLYAKDASNNCVPLNAIIVNGSRYPNIRTFAHIKLTEIVQAMMNKSPLTAEQEGILVSIPQFIHMSIKNDIMKYGNSANASNIAESYTDLVSTLTTYAAIRDLINTFSNALAGSYTITANKNSAESTNCQVKLSADAQNVLSVMIDRLYQFKLGFEKEYDRKTEMFFKYYAAANTKEKEYKETLKDKQDELGKTDK